MNRQSIAKRIEQAAEQSKAQSKSVILKCWLSDGSIEKMDMWQAMMYNRGDLIGDRVVFQEPHIIKVECISGADIAPKMLSIVEQAINYANESRD